MVRQPIDNGVQEQFLRDEDDLEDARTRIVKFIKNCASEFGRSGLLVDVGRGINAAVVAMLAVEALGDERVHGVVFKSGSDIQSTLAVSELVAEGLDIGYSTVSLLPFVHLFQEEITIDREIHERTKPFDVGIDRLQLACATAMAESANYLLATTYNRTEWLLEERILHGRAKSEILPIGHLYRTEVTQLAEEMGVPIDAFDPPFFDISVFESVETVTLDRILNLLVDADLGIAQTASEVEVDRQTVEAVAERNARNRQNRGGPTLLKTARTARYERFHEVELQFVDSRHG